MGKRKEKYAPKKFESIGVGTDTSANIYMSMLLSENWQRLSKNAQVLYVYCKAQYYAEKNKPKPIIRQLSDDQLKRCFTMNKSKWDSLYHIYTNHTQFEKDMKSLVDLGFIELIENGKTSRTKSIYMLSDNWVKGNN